MWINGLHVFLISTVAVMLLKLLFIFFCSLGLFQMNKYRTSHKCGHWLNVYTFTLYLSQLTCMSSLARLSICNIRKEKYAAGSYKIFAIVAKVKVQDFREYD